MRSISSFGWDMTRRWEVTTRQRSCDCWIARLLYTSHSRNPRTMRNCSYSMSSGALIELHQMDADYLSKKPVGLSANGPMRLFPIWNPIRNSNPATKEVPDLCIPRTITPSWWESFLTWLWIVTIYLLFVAEDLNSLENTKAMNPIQQQKSIIPIEYASLLPTAEWRIR